jgi:hypothetical protein
MAIGTIHTKTKAGMCCKCISHKNHDKNKCRRDGERSGRWQQGYERASCHEDHNENMTLFFSIEIFSLENKIVIFDLEVSF